MKKSILFILSIFMLWACKNSEKSNSIHAAVESYNRQALILAIDIQIEKTSSANDFTVVNTQIDTLEYMVTPRPTTEDLPETFKIEVLDASNKTVFGSQHKTSFRDYEDTEITNIKFFCSVPDEAIGAKIYYLVSDGVWKQVAELDL